MKRPKMHRLLAMLIMVAVLFPIAVSIGCNIMTVYEDGTIRDAAGNYYTRTQALNRAGSCGFCGEAELHFESQAAYDNFMTWARGYISGIQDPRTRAAYESQLQLIERERLPPGAGGGVELPSTSTEGGHTGGGSKGGGGK